MSAEHNRTGVSTTPDQPICQDVILVDEHTQIYFREHCVPRIYFMSVSRLDYRAFVQIEHGVREFW